MSLLVIGKSRGDTARLTGQFRRFSAIAIGLNQYFKFGDGKIAYYRGVEDISRTGAVLRD
jgi:hypothetical protein